MRPLLGEVRYHKRTGTMYIYEIIPGPRERVGWVRFDTWFWGAWDRFPDRVVSASRLVSFDRPALGLPGTAADPTFVRMAFE